MNAAAPLLADAAPRAPQATTGLYESYFLRANHPSRPLALWTKATVLKPTASTGLQESWFVFFDGEKNRVFADKRTEPLVPSFARASDTSLALSVCEASWTIAPKGAARGAMEHALWDVRFERMSGALGEPRSFYPPKLLTGSFPRAKGVTPMPALTMDGTVDVFGERVDVEGWYGALGHNWGREHPRRHAWAQCFFPAAAGAPAAWLEAITGSVKLAGPVSSPLLSTMIVQRGDASFRFDRVFEAWRQHPHIEERRYTLEVTSADGRARLEVDRGDRPVACLGYRDPTGMLGYCINSKLARTKLTVEPARGAPFTLESEHGGALEFVQRTPAPGLRVV